MTNDATASDPYPCVTLGDLRRATEGLPDTTPLVIETADEDLIDTYQRVALGVIVRAYGNGALTVNLTDTPEGRAA